MSEPSTPERTRKPLTAVGVVGIVVLVLLVLLVPPFRVLGGLLLIAVFVAIGIAYALIWARIGMIRRKRRKQVQR
ncbi:hypothetical protein [Glycomyces artemisiae]|nr:hypothetical protein [Glycomyces artemisiae]